VYGFLDLSADLTLHSRIAVAAGIERHSRWHTRNEPYTTKTVQESWRPHLGANIALLGVPAAGLLGIVEVSHTPVTVYDSGDLDFPTQHGSFLRPRLGLGYRWIAHPGATFQIDAGVAAPGLPISLPTGTQYVAQNVYPRDVTWTPWIAATAGWSFAVPGPAPKPGYRKGSFQAEYWVVGAATAAGLVWYTTMLGTGAWKPASTGI